MARKLEITARWGNDDAESTIKLTPRQWEKIKERGEYDRPA